MPITTSTNIPTGKALWATVQKLGNNGYLFLQEERLGEKHKAHIKFGDSNKAVDMTYYFHKIEENEHLELFLLWLVEYRRKISKADNISLTGKVDYLLQHVQGKAKSKVVQSFETSDVCTQLTAAEQTPTNITLKKKISNFSSKPAT